MSHKISKVDKVFLTSVILLLIYGLAIFLSASLGILAKDQAQFNSVAFKQIFLGITLGLLACFIFSKINYKVFKKYPLYFFLFSIILTGLVFVPGLGMTLNGATRWLNIFGFSFQPTTILSFCFIVFWASWLAHYKDKLAEVKYSLLPISIIFVIIGGIFLMQPDTDSFFVLAITGTIMLWIAGGKSKHIIYLFLLGVVLISVLALARPYVMSRIMTFINPAENAQTSSYQVQQSYIAIGSGEMFGRGWGQSIQKYKFLPESISDSIFAVLGEEFGFIGSIVAIGLFLFFAFRGFRISINSPDNFSGLLVAGIVILIIVQSFVNIASMLGLFPFSGIPLIFFSQGGTSMLITLAEIGVILNVSRQINNTKR